MGVNLIVPPKVPKVRLDGRSIRDALLSLPDNERAFIITNPEPGEHPVTKIVLDVGADEQVMTTP